MVNFPLQFFYYYVISDGLNLVTTTVILPYAAILYCAYISYDTSYNNTNVVESKRQFNIELILHLGVTLVVFAIFLFHFLEIW
ncbi:MAG: hypothetical protein LUG46_05385 [Erysipelotrichaceae bacterium]|nr:hypothetical protein [Erysipelotrichaceae bacterium]